MIHALNLDGVGAGTADVGAHGVQEVGQIHDVGFLGGVLNDGVAVCQSCGHHDVHGGTHGNHIQIDIGTVQPTALGVGQNEAAFHHHLGAQSGEALDVLVNGTHTAEVAAAGHGNLRTAETAQQRTDEIVAGADLVGQFVGGAGGADAGGVDLHRVGIDAANGGAQALQDPQAQRYVGDLGDVFNAANPVHQKGGGDDGNSSVFGAADLYFTKERLAAANQILRQCRNLSYKRGIYTNRSLTAPGTQDQYSRKCEGVCKIQQADQIFRRMATKKCAAENRRYSARIQHSTSGTEKQYPVTGE